MVYYVLIEYYRDHKTVDISIRKIFTDKTEALKYIFSLNGEESNNLIDKNTYQFGITGRVIYNKNDQNNEDSWYAIIEVD